MGRRCREPLTRLSPPRPRPSRGPPPGAPTKSGPASGPLIPDFAALLAWLDGLGTTGLDGHELSELGLKSGNLTVDDQPNGKQRDFPDTNITKLSRQRT